MITHTPQSHSGRRGPRWWANLFLWQRILFVVVLLGALVMSVGLISYGPRLATAVPTRSPTHAATTTPGPIYPSGIDEPAIWNQNRPLDQQP